MLASGKQEVSLYFHIPFCKKKCPYCHFYVLPDNLELKEMLLAALILEWKRERPRLEGKKIVSIYFGGGTPSLFGAEAIGTILNLIDRDAGCEITLEANPEDVTQEKIQKMRDVGINRVSMGVQSLDDSSLQILGREHSAKTALAAIDAIQRAGIENLSIDLMYDLPEQSFSSWKRTIERVEELPITHLSLYNLTIEPETLFFKRKKSLLPLLPTPTESLKMLTHAVEQLERWGFKRYEISAFAKEGYASRHNSGYWTARPFLGFGPSAFSFWEGKRFRNIAHLKRYSTALEQNKPTYDFEEKLPYPDNLHELLAVELRLLAGVNLATFQARHGPLPSSTHSSLETLKQKGWLEQHSHQLKLTEEGLLFYDSVATAII